MSAAVDMRRKKSSAAGKKSHARKSHGKKRQSQKAKDQKRSAKLAKLKKAKPNRASGSVDATLRGATSGWGWGGVGVGVVLLAVCIGLGVQVASQSQRMRALYSQLQQDQELRDALLAERSRLLLERGALNSYSGAEALAREQLDMRFPESITRLEVDADDSSGQSLIGSRRRR